MRSYRPPAQRRAESTRRISAAVPDDQLMAEPHCMLPWDSTRSYITGECCAHADHYWRCLQDHTGQAGWAPGVAPSLWARIDVEEWPEWHQPGTPIPGQGAVYPAYELGAKVTHAEKHWISKINANTTEPGADARWWEEVV